MLCIALQESVGFQRLILSQEQVNQTLRENPPLYQEDPLIKAIMYYLPYS